MPSTTLRRFILLLAAVVCAAAPASAQVDARMFRQPAVSADKIAFIYAGDIWLVPKTSGVATRLSSPLSEESFPRFSPDGARFVYMPMSQDFRNWKRYRGGWAPDL